MPVQIYLDLLLLLLVVAAAVSDLATRRIPNRLLAAGFFGAMLLHLFSPAPGASALLGLAGAATGLALFFPLYCLRGMAAGDVKFLAAAGAFGTPVETLQIAVLGACAGGVMALLVLVCRGRVRAALTNVGSLLRPLLKRMAGLPVVAEPMAGPSVGTIPYGLAIASGALIVIAQRYS